MPRSSGSGSCTLENENILLIGIKNQNLFSGSIRHHVAGWKQEAKKIFYLQKRTGLVKKGFGFIHIYYGRGVGKSTRAVGLAIRAAGSGLQVDIVQFMKSGTSSEVSIFKTISNIRYRCPGKHPFIMTSGPRPVHYEHASKALNYAFEAIEKGTSILICDEVLDTLIFDVLKKECILELIEKCKKNKIELVMTGVNAPAEIIRKADYVTELVQVKHAYYEGARARKGIEY
jgi:cob(I)alamin adenosyltransferase